MAVRVISWIRRKRVKRIVTCVSKVMSYVQRLVDLASVSLLGLLGLPRLPQKSSRIAIAVGVGQNQNRCAVQWTRATRALAQSVAGLAALLVSDNEPS